MIENPVSKIGMSTLQIKENSIGVMTEDILGQILLENTSSAKNTISYQISGNKKRNSDFDSSKDFSNSSSITRKANNNSDSKKTLLSTQTNTPPIADLKYLILNEESLYNGKVTKETQIAWLYAYGEDAFTYDPDGDDIINMTIGGLPENTIIKEIDGMGFITQFSSPGIYTMTFQVEDEHGGLSNIVSFNIEVVDYNAITQVKLNTYTPTNPIPDSENGRYMNYNDGLNMAQNGESEPQLFRTILFQEIILRIYRMAL
ncbi:hypothetical protein [Clostridium minihomine]|uniref:hypothetical protein n=1 Tax=Clostridium minihomine TaxID=2045012 RepID=UPI000C789C3C|nr:hypothetical protein [Clostridium minihomine]